MNKLFSLVLEMNQLKKTSQKNDLFNDPVYKFNTLIQ